MSVAAGTVATMLSVKDHMRLRLAGARYRHPAQRDTDALEQLGETPTTFWLRVDQLLDDPDAFAAEPQVVGRLRRLRDARAAARRAG